MNLKLNFKVIMALLKRDLRMYFTNPTGYVFITLFILLSAGAAFWQERFFLNNLANLDQLNNWFPYLLLFFIPALTMGVWATENKQGTDELLFTLPATDLEVVLGKFFATLGIYSAALILSISHVIVLIFLGSPDLGLMFGNYFGYWLSGAALIAVGMLASLLTSNITIAFILGAVFCSFFVFIDTIGGIFSNSIRDFVAPLGIEGHFRDFSRGVISFSGLLYFLSLTGFMIYLNVLLIGRRHWPLEADGYRMSIHHTVRGVALVIALISINAILSRASLRLDVTAEQLYSLSHETKNLLKQLPDDRTVFIQAYLSKDVPQHYVQTKQNLVGFLDEIDAAAGKRVEVVFYDTEPFTDEARDAREKFGINPVEVPDPGSARQSISQVFMGVAFTSGAEEQVIPFFDRGLPVEYELTRSIRVVAGTRRKKIGVVNTDAKVFGGFDFNTFNSTPEWQVVQELKKQYEVVQIAATSPITEEVDGLMVALPSALPQEEMDNLLAFIETGVPALIVDDPLPIVNIGLAPVERSGANRNPFMQNQGPPPKPKGNIQGFLDKLGFNWNIRQIVWDAYNPHPEIATVQPEIIFLGQGNKNPNTFNRENIASSGLQELVLLFPGNIRKGVGTTLEYTPLLQSGATSGIVQYEQLVQRSFFGTQLVSRGVRRFPDSQEHTFAAMTKGTIAPKDSTDMPKNINTVFISDLDFISEQFFEIRKRGFENLNFDNVTFFLNCMDILVGDSSFVELRKRRVRHRTLTTVENQIQKYVEKRADDERQAETEAQLALTEAQNRLNETVAEIRNRTDLDEQTKSIMARNRQEVENRKFEAQKSRIEAQKEAKIASSKENMEGQIRNIQSGIKFFAVLLPPIPVFILGVMIFVRRQRREREGEAAARRLRS
jgi:ABC-2 type transport system permease protein